MKLKYFSPVLFSLFIVSGFLYSSCQRPFDNTANALKADTLQHMVNTIDQTLVLDEDAFKTRNDSMVTKLDKIHTAHKDSTADGETKSAIIRYNGIHKNYDDYLKAYPIMEFDCDKHKKTVADIKEKVLGQKISQEEFDKNYIAEKALLEDLLKKAKTTTYNTYSIEEDYRRMDPVVTRVYHEIR